MLDGVRSLEHERLRRVTCDVQESCVMQSVVPTAQGDEVRVRIVATLFAMEDVVHIEMLARATTGHAASVPIASQDPQALLPRQGVLRTSIRVIDVAHDRRIARQRRELCVIELHTVCEAATIRRDPNLRW
jgi:hypothetical protein